MALKELLDKLWHEHADYLIISCGAPPTIKMDNRFVSIGSESLTPEQAKDLVYEVLNPEQKETIEKKGDLDFSFGIKGMCRFRGNAFMQRGSITAVINTNPFTPPSWEDIKGPKNVLPLLKCKNGLIIVTGSTGSGKTTVMTSLIDYINSNLFDHIITIEDPIEYLHSHKKSIVHQRQIGTDTDSFQTAVNYILRQNPDVVMLGEVRNLDMMAAALTIAQTSCLCIFPLHATDTIAALDRIIKAFPNERQELVRKQLAECFLFAVASQLMLKAKGRGRFAAYEVLMNDAKVKKIIEGGNLNRLKSYLDPSIAKSIRKLKKAGKIKT
jgi:twitching motility protein PilT